MTISINLCSAPTVLSAKGFDDWMREYIEETANPVIGKAEAQVERYLGLDREGKLRCIAVFDDMELAGMAVLYVTESGHYPFPMIGIDAIYLRKAWRKGRLGLDLWGAVKALVKREGAPGFPVMAPPGSNLDRLCKAFKLVPTHNTYWCPCDE